MTQRSRIIIVFYFLLTLNLIIFGGPHLPVIIISTIIAMFLFFSGTNQKIPGSWFWNGLILISIVQLIPLPENILKIISPATYQILQPLHNSALIVHTIWHPISLSPINTLQFIALMFISLTIYTIAYKWITIERREIQRFFNYLAGISLFTIGVEIINRIVNNGKIYGFTLERKHAFGQFINSNFAATIFGMSLLIYIHFSITRQKTEKKVIGLIISGLIYAGIFMTLSRSVVVYTSLLIIYSMISYLQQDEKKIIREKILVLILAVVIISYDIININLQPLLAKFEVVHGSIAIRKLIWASAFNAFKHSPLFGIGFGSLREAFPFYVIPLRVTIPNPDFDLLQFATEGGIITFSLVLYMIYWNIKVEKEKIGQIPIFYKKYIRGLDMALILFFLHSFFAYVFFFPMTNYIFAAILGVRNGILYRKKLKSSRQEKNPYSSRS